MAFNIYLPLYTTKTSDMLWHGRHLYKFISYELSSQFSALFFHFSVIVRFGWFWMEGFRKNVLLMLRFLKAPFLVLVFFYYAFLMFLVMLSLEILSMLIALLSTENVVGLLICGYSLSWLLNLDFEILWTGVGMGLLYLMLRKLNLIDLILRITLAPLI